MKMFKIGFGFVFSLLAAGAVFNLLYHPEIGRVLVAQRQEEMRQFADARRLERRARSSTTQREALAQRMDTWMHSLHSLHSLHSPLHLHRHSLSGGVKA